MTKFHLVATWFMFCMEIKLKRKEKMRKFVSLVLAAVMGSALTVAITGAWKNDNGNGGVRIEHVSGVPVTQVGYKKNEKGEIVPLDFTSTAEKVTAAVVHIRSTSSGRA